VSVLILTRVVQRDVVDLFGLDGCAPAVRHCAGRGLLWSAALRGRWTMAVGGRLDGVRGVG
jgi:hypothetical protein